LLELARLGLLVREAGFEVFPSRDGPRFFLNTSTRFLDLNSLMAGHGIEPVSVAGPMPALGAVTAAKPHGNLSESRKDLANSSPGNTISTSMPPNGAYGGTGGGAVSSTAHASDGEELGLNPFAEEVLAHLAGGACW
jgi:hypothetical protein